MRKKLILSVLILTAFAMTASATTNRHLRTYPSITTEAVRTMWKEIAAFIWKRNITTSTIKKRRNITKTMVAEAMTNTD